MKNIYVVNGSDSGSLEADKLFSKMVSWLVDNYDVNVYVDAEDKNKCDHMIVVNDSVGSYSVGSYSVDNDPVSIESSVFGNDLYHFDKIWSMNPEFGLHYMIAVDCDGYTNYSRYYDTVNELIEFNINYGNGVVIDRLESGSVVSSVVGEYKIDGSKNLLVVANYLGLV